MGTFYSCEIAKSLTTLSCLFSTVYPFSATKLAFQKPSESLHDALASPLHRVTPPVCDPASLHLCELPPQALQHRLSQDGAWREGDCDVDLLLLRSFVHKSYGEIAAFVANVLSFVGAEERGDDVGGGAFEKLKGLSGGRGREDGRGVRSHFVCFASGVRVASRSVGVTISGCELARRCGGRKESGPDCVVGWVEVGGG
jgi:hypothetical protein